MENYTLQKYKMFHQKVKEIQIQPNLNNFYKIMDFDDKTSFVLKLLSEFIYIDDNIYRTLNVRKLIDFYKNNKNIYQNMVSLNEDNEIINILKYLSKDHSELIDIKWLKEEIFSSIIVKPLLLFNYYKTYIEKFEEFLNNLKRLIKEGNADSFIIASLLKVKLVVVNNILEYYMENNKLALMRYSGTPLPGGKSFIILKILQDL